MFLSLSSWEIYFKLPSMRAISALHVNINIVLLVKIFFWGMFGPLKSFPVYVADNQCCCE